MNATNNIETRTIKARALGMTFNIVINAEYDIVKRNNGWGITKNGEFINEFYYMSKYAASVNIPDCKYEAC